MPAGKCDNCGQVATTIHYTIVPDASRFPIGTFIRSPGIYLCSVCYGRYRDDPAVKGRAAAFTTTFDGVLPGPGVIELPVKARNTAKLSPPPGSGLLEQARAELKRQEAEQLPARAASRYAAPVNRKRGRFGLPWWLWPAE